MDFRKIALSAAAVAALSPAICAANPEKTALSACVQAFAAKISTAGADSPSVKVKYKQRPSSSSIIDYYTHEYTFSLSARNAKTGTEFAQATCEADTHGSILAMTTQVTDAVATLAAR